MISYSIRIANERDIDKIIGVFEDSIQNIDSALYTDNQKAEWLKTASNTTRWLTALQSQEFLVAQHEDLIIGFISLNIEASYIDFLYVASSYWGKGVAQALYKHLENLAHKVDVRYLSSDVSKAAKPFFEKNGFVVIRENQNQRGNEILINYRMEKQLIASAP